MKRIPLSIPEIAIVAGTRAALGAGAALLLGERISSDQRRAVGWTLLAFGAISTIPIIAQLVSSRDIDEEEPTESSRLRFIRPEYASR